MSADELNPEHPVTQAMREEWHKIVALILWKYARTEECRFSAADVSNFQRRWPDPVIVVESTTREDPDGELIVSLMPRARAERLARGERGH